MANAIRGFVSAGLVAAIAAFVGTWLSIESAAQTDKPTIAGAWTINKDLSDHPADRSNGGDSHGNRGGYGGGGGHRRGGGGGYGGGGYGGGGRGGYGNGGQPQMDPETAQRVREAVRDITNPPEKITITQTDSMVVITTADGRTTRLSPDGKKIKDENTGIERKTHWDTGKLVTEISGPNGMKVTQTYALNPDLHQLRLTTQVEGQRGGQARTMSTVYDGEQK
jgi:hypothetical protein